MARRAKETADREDLVRSILREMKLRVTPIRRAILQRLLDAGHALSATDLLHRIPKADVVTVYRNIEVFAEKGILHKIRGKDREWLFAIGAGVRRREHVHPHFVCEGCGSVQCLSDVHLPEGLSTALNVEAGYQVSYAEVLFHGRCPRCSP